ncbi:carbonic anhydrase 3-like [Diorhabda sublineata]|uniref:carbonic anhydrase 3-like n=1 Tax=Diorhabda sublineata TaxID=1163346 RepID=UPI0024E1727F|nr:carbonic anhydrase 3-like [Diorhabda sublineata]
MSKIDSSTNTTKTDETNIESNEEEVNEDEVEQDVYEKQLCIRDLPITEGCFESPIDINLKNTKVVILPPLVWVNFENPPKKTKITNTGQTIIFSAKWKEERPYITNGPFVGNYVFSNFHLHWGCSAMEGSEHTMDGCKYPVELHAIFFKSCYLTQESALKEQDGIAALVYLFKIQDDINPGFQIIIDSLKDIATAGNSKKIENIVVTRLFKEFRDDYFLYWGSVSTEKCIHYVLWLITRIPIGLSIDQIDALRYIFDENGEPLLRNYRDVQDSNNRSVFHVSPSTSLYSSLLPLPEHEVVQIY